MHDGSVVLVFVPALVAYLFLQTVIDTTRLYTLKHLYMAIFKLWSAKAEANDLDLLALPYMPLYWNLDSPGHASNEMITDKLELVATGLVQFPLMLSVFVFAFTAYRKLYMQPISHHILWLIGAIVTGVFLIYSYVYMMVSARTMRSEWAS